MKKTRKIISLLLSILMIITSVPLMALNSFAASSGDYEYYILKDGTAQINHYEGSETEIEIPSENDGHRVTFIVSGAFDGCKSLTSVTNPDSVIEIGWGAFCGCSGLTSIYVYTEKLPNMGSDVFHGCDAKKCTVYVPKGTYDDYWLSEFGYFENIVEFEATGINNVVTSNDAKELSRYSVNGQRLSAPTKGLNIVKYSDGSVKKVAVQ